jgi:hypothetical protein
MSPSILRFIVSFEVPVLQGDQSRYWHFPFRALDHNDALSESKKREASARRIAVGWEVVVSRRRIADPTAVSARFSGRLRFT